MGKRVRFDTYQDASGEWRWRMVDGGNGRIRGVSGESFTRHTDATRAIESLRDDLVIDAATLGKGKR